MSGGLNLWIVAAFNWSILQTSTSVCKFLPFSIYTTLDFSISLIVIMTYEKLYAVYSPMKASQLKFNRKRSKVIVIAALVVCSLINTHFLFSHSLVEIQIDQTISFNESKEMVHVCTNHQWFKFYDSYWIYIDAIIYSFLPLTLISIFNILIIVCLVKEKKIASKLQEKADCSSYEMACKTLLKINEPTVSKSKSNLTITKTDILQLSSSNRSINSIRSINSKIVSNNINDKNLQMPKSKSITEYEFKKFSKTIKRAKKMHQKSNKRLTIMIFLINVSFCILTIPIVILQIMSRVDVSDDKIQLYFEDNLTTFILVDEAIEKNNNFDLLKSLFELLQFLNHAINFILYCLIGKTFRKEAQVVISTFFKCFLCCNISQK